MHFIDQILGTDSVLILGGGSGNLLKKLLKRYPQLTVDYIDISAKMIQLAREKTQNPSIVNFIVGTEQNIPNRNYTVVITNFYLDLFAEQTLERVIQKIKTHLNPEARWLVTDFVSEKGWHKIMLWIMYRFFRIVAGIEARKLPNWQQYLIAVHGRKIMSKKFYAGFVMASVFEFKTGYVQERG